MSNFGTIVCDLDGVLFRGAEPIPGAGEALERIAAAGIRLLFATNNSSRSAADTAAAIKSRTGFDAAVDAVVTSGMAAADHLTGRAYEVLVVGMDGLAVTLEAAGFSVGGGVDAEAVVVGLDRGFSYDKLLTATTAIRAGALLVATNDDPTYPTPRGLAPGAGSLVAAVERAGGVPAEVCGKPHAPMGRLVAARATGAVLMVGDRIETDIEFGKQQGWATALALTGVTNAEDAGRADADFVIGSIAELPDLVV